MSWNDPFVWLVAGVVVLIAVKWLVMSVIDVRDRWAHRRTFSWAEAPEDADDDDESDVLDTIHCRIDDAGERVDRLEAADRHVTSAIALLITSCRSLDGSITSTANDVEDLRRRVEALEGQCQPLADGLYGEGE